MATIKLMQVPELLVALGLDVTTASISSDYTPDFSTRNWALTLGASVTINNPSNLAEGQCGVIEIIQDGTGGYAASWGSYFDFGGSGAPSGSTTANGHDTYAYYVVSTTKNSLLVLTS